MTKKLCVLVSGGLDSTVAAALAISEVGINDVALLYIDTKHPYSAKELDTLNTLFDRRMFTAVQAQFAVPELDNSPTLERQEVYARNLLLATYGAQLAPEVWLSSLETEMTPLSVSDKHPSFFTHTSALLTYLMRHKHSQDIRLKTPFRYMTKTDVVAIGLRLGLSKSYLASTTSCYSADHHSCGSCSTCFKRYVAFKNNNVEDTWDSDPERNSYGQTVVALMLSEIERRNLSGRFTLARFREMENAGFLPAGISCYAAVLFSNFEKTDT